jgi:outer membrane protein assembly factor BamB
MIERGAVLFVVALLATACAGDDTEPQASRSTEADAPATTQQPEVPAPPTTVELPPEVVEHADDWPTAGQDLDNTRTAAEGSRLTTDTVGDLDVAWRAELPEVGALSTAPRVLGDTGYVQGATGQLVALDRTTGEQRWASETSGFNIGPFGAAVGHGRAYGVHGSNGIVAVDLADGREVWSTTINTPPTEGVDIQPVVAGGLVLASTVPVSIGGIYTGGDRGTITALDAETGQVRWTFDTIEGDLWGNPEVNSGGGSWYPPVVDPERGLAYFGVANPAPFPGTAEWPNATSRPGPNLYTNSVVALEVESGELAWYHQVVPHDLFDRDQVHTLMAEVDGDDVVVSAGKSGIVVGLDPDEGTVLWEQEVGRHDNDDLPELDGPTFVAPGTYGGVLTPPSTADGVVYLATVDAATELRPDETAYFGAPLGTEDGEVTAVDAGTGAVLWEVDVPGDPLGGTAVVNDLVFTALLDGTVLALDRADGTEVWRHEAAGGINGWMAIVGDEVFVPVGNASPAEVLALRLP